MAGSEVESALEEFFLGTKPMQSMLRPSPRFLIEGRYHLNIGLLGYGRFGQALGSLLHGAGHAFRAWDPYVDVPAQQGVANLHELARGCEVLVLAVPVSGLEGALTQLKPHLRAGQLVFDVASVKSRPCALLEQHLGSAIAHVGTHPLFGPVSLARAERPLRVIICPSGLHPGAADQVERLFKGLGCEVLRQSPEDHDRVMAATHALTFFIAKGLLAVGAGAQQSFAPPSFHAIARTLESVQGDAGHLFATLQNQNPFAAGAREAFIDALTSIHQSLGEAQTSGADEQFSIPDLGMRSPALQQARDHIDALDQELVALLARRTELVLRAGIAKAQLGLPIHDAEREASQLQARRAWAHAASLDSSGVEEVFKAVLRASRAVQGNKP